MSRPGPVQWSALSRWLRDHDGVITATEADAIDILGSTRRTLITQGRLHRVHRGVFVDASLRPSPLRALRVAVAACGRGALASHQSAAWLQGLLGQPPARPHVTVPPDRHPRLPGIVAHQASIAGDMSRCRGIPVTSPARTLIDLAASTEVTAARLAAAIDAAFAANLATPASLIVIADPHEGRHGAPRLRRALESRGHLGAPEASVLELRARRLFRQLHRQYGIPEPESEHGVHTAGSHYRLDFAWPPLLLAVEVDGYVWHASSGAMAHDLARRNELTGAGWTVLVFTWHQVVHDPEGFLGRVAAAYRRAFTATKKACPTSRAGSG